MSSENHDTHAAEPHAGADAPHDVHDFTGPLSPGVALFIKSFIAVAAVLALLDFLVDRAHHDEPGHETYVKIDQLPTFYAIYGFVGCVVLVLVAKEMRKVVMRDETYYDEPPSGDAGGHHGEGVER